MHHLLQRVTRARKEGLQEYCVRVIKHHCSSDIPGVDEDMIQEVIEFYRDTIVAEVETAEREKAVRDRWHISAKLSEAERELNKYKVAYTTLKENTPTSIPLREAEAGCAKSFSLAREKAAMLFEEEGGQPTAASEAIRAIPDPKPRWSRV